MCVRWCEAVAPFFLSKYTYTLSFLPSVGCPSLPISLWCQHPCRCSRVTLLRFPICCCSSVATGSERSCQALSSPHSQSRKSSPCGMFWGIHVVSGPHTLSLSHFVFFRCYSDLLPPPTSGLGAFVPVFFIKLILSGGVISPGWCCCATFFFDFS